ncbi:MAG: Fe-S cluster assembly protein SufD [Bacteroidota bacterium]
MAILVDKQTALRMYEKVFEELISRDGSEPEDLRVLRRGAFTRFKELGFPTNKHEEWRFTNVSPVTTTYFSTRQHESTSVRIPDPARWSFAGDDAVTVVLVNGIWSEELSNVRDLPPGIEVLPLPRAIALRREEIGANLGKITDSESNPFSALNTALFDDGVLIHVHAGASISRPVQILAFSAPSERPLVIFPRILVVAGRDSSVSLVEMYAGDEGGPGFTNAITEVYLAEGARVEHDKVQIESSKHYHIATMAVRQAERSVFTSNAISFGGLLVRNGVEVTLAGRDADCTLNGLSVAAGTQLVDNHTSIDHATEHCTSHELYKTILGGSARGVFNGKIFVRPGAQKTDAKQTNKTVLLSTEALMHTKPQLEIFADDVKCTHGATIGQLDDEQLFYLRARGIDRDTARDMLTLAFANDVVSRIHVDPLKEHLEQLLRDRLHAGHARDNHD